MQCIKLAVAFLIVFSGNIFATELATTPSATPSNKIYQNGASTNSQSQTTAQSTVTVEQGGLRNQGFIAQHQPGSNVNLKQHGSYNAANIAQTAAYDIANIDQAGSNNTITTVQNSGNNSVDIQQDVATSNSDIVVHQSSVDSGIDAGGSRIAQIQQHGAIGSTVNITQDTASAAYVSQSGSQNSITIVQR